MANGITGMNFFNRILRAPDDGAGAGPTTDSNSANPETVSTNDVLATLRHDPFPGGEAPKDDKVTKNTTAKADGKAGASKAAPAAGANGKPADGGTSAQPATNTPAADPEKEALRQSVNHATELLDAYRSRDKQSAAAAPGAGNANAGGGNTGGASATAEPTYDFNIPDQLVSALTNEDPAVFKQGLAGFGKGIAMGVHKEVVGYMEKTLPAIMEKIIPAMIQSQMHSYNSNKAIFDDFYGTYKELNNPKIYPLVAQITTEVQKELKTTAWSPALRDTVATRVKDFIQSIGGTVNKVPAAQPAAKHPVLAGGNNSRGAVETLDKVEMDIMDTLFSGQA